MKPGLQEGRSWNYERAFFVTLGLWMTGLAVAVWFWQGPGGKEWPVKAWMVFGALVLGGVFFLWLAFRSDRVVMKWMRGSGSDEGSLLVAMIAGPVYWVGKWAERKGKR